MHNLSGKTFLTRGYHRAKNDSSNKLLEYIAKPPSKNEPAWARLANQIKNEDHYTGIVKKFESNINEICDRRDHISKIEDELREEMAKSLGRTGQKCVYAFDQLTKAKEKCTYFIRTVSPGIMCHSQDCMNCIIVYIIMNLTQNFKYQAYKHVVILKSNIEPQ